MARMKEFKTCFIPDTEATSSDNHTTTISEPLPDECQIKEKNPPPNPHNLTINDTALFALNLKKNGHRNEPTEFENKSSKLPVIVEKDENTPMHLNLSTDSNQSSNSLQQRIPQRSKTKKLKKPQIRRRNAEKTDDSDKKSSNNLKTEEPETRTIQSFQKLEQPEPEDIVSPSVAPMSEEKTEQKSVKFKIPGTQSVKKMSLFARKKNTDERDTKPPNSSEAETPSKLFSIESNVTPADSKSKTKKSTKIHPNRQEKSEKITDAEKKSSLRKNKKPDNPSSTNKIKSKDSTLMKLLSMKKTKSERFTEDKVKVLKKNKKVFPIRNWNTKCFRKESKFYKRLEEPMEKKQKTSTDLDAKKPTIIQPFSFDKKVQDLLKKRRSYFETNQQPFEIKKWARSPTVLRKKPFTVKVGNKKTTVPIKINLRTSERSVKWLIFEQNVNKRQEKVLKEKLRKEKQDLINYRKTLIHRASPIPYELLGIKPKNITRHSLFQSASKNNSFNDDPDPIQKNFKLNTTQKNYSDCVLKKKKALDEMKNVNEENRSKIKFKVTELKEDDEKNDFTDTTGKKHVSINFIEETDETFSSDFPSLKSDEDDGLWEFQNILT